MVRKDTRYGSYGYWSSQRQRLLAILRFHLLEAVFAKGIRFDIRSSVLTLKVSAELVSWKKVQYETTTGPGVLGHRSTCCGMVPVSEVWLHEYLLWNEGLGLWGSM